MNELTKLHDIVMRLLSNKKEGQYWDFKQKHHKDKGELIHDILCLANAKHDGPRYLIYGVSPDNYSILGVDDSEMTRTQADIISIFSDNQSKFAFGLYPDFRLETITIDKKRVDVLVIENCFYKPYFATNKIDCVRANSIYTRVMDRNTPKDSSAAPNEIEYMWQERFGLTLPAKEKVKRFLSDYGNWEHYTLEDGNSCWFYKTFPEFTVQIEDAARILGSRQEWTRGEINQDLNSAFYYSVYVHQTRLAQIHAVCFDDGRKAMVAPAWKPALRGRLYFYEKDSLALEMQAFHVANNGGVDHSKNLRLGPLPDSVAKISIVPEAASAVPIPIASCELVEKFLQNYDSERSLDPIREEVMQYQVFLQNQFAFHKWLSDQS